MVDPEIAAMSTRSTSSEESHFLQAIKAGDLETVRQMVQTNRNILFVADAVYGSPLRMATAMHPQIANYLAHVVLQRLRSGSIPETNLYGAIHDLGEATHSETGYRGCETLRAEAEPDIVALLKHPDEEIRGIAVSVLTFHWNAPGRKNRDELIVLLLHDPDNLVKSTAAAGLGFVLRDSRDPVVSAALVETIQDTDEDPSLRETAYDALGEVWSSPRADQSAAEIRAKAEIQRQKELQAAPSRQDFQRRLWLWRDHQETLSKIDWELVERIKRTIQTEASGEPS